MHTLQQCLHLRELQLTCSTAAAGEWQAITGLSRLSSIRLSMSTSAAEALQPAFTQPSLNSALCSLDVSSSSSAQLQAATLQSLRWLTALKLSVFQPLSGSPEDLSAALQHMTRLQSLELVAWPRRPLFNLILQPEPALPLSTDEDIAQLKDYLDGEDTLEVILAALQGAPDLYLKLFSAAHQGLLAEINVWQAFAATVTEDSAAA